MAGVLCRLVAAVGLAAAFVGAMSIATGEAQAATTVTGESEAQGALTIDPGSDPRTWGQQVYFGLPIYAIEEMPVTKRVASVTLGDFARGCSSGVPGAYLRIYESTTGRRVDGALIATSTNYPSFPTSTAGPVTWTIPATTFREGRAYFFTLYNESGGCQSAVDVTTWAHTEPQVDGGPGPCDEFSRPSAGQYLRVWHELGASDWSCNSYTAPEFDIFLPSGWLLWLRTSDAAPMTQLRRPDGSVASSQCYYGTQPAYWKPHPTLSGWTIWACEFMQFSDPLVDVANGWHFGLQWQVSGSDYPPREMYLRLETIDYDALLAQYAPVLKFDSESEYWNASPATLTDWPENQLHYNLLGTGCSPSSVFDHDDDDWGLETLVTSDATYPGTDCNPVDQDYLDTDGDDKDAADSFRYGPLDNKIYGRVVHDEDGAVWLQYWLFYYYNELSVLGVGAHQGDWEMVQFRLGALNVPDTATYAQHSGGESCPWNKVESYGLTEGGVVVRQAPVVYPAAGSQSSYFVGGTHVRTGLPDDSADGLGELRNSGAGLVSLAGPPAWAAWPGRWGEDAASPSGPSSQTSKWDDPKGFDDAAGPCSNPDGTPR